MAEDDGQDKRAEAQQNQDALERSLEAVSRRHTRYLEEYATRLNFPVEAFKVAEQGRLAYALAGLRIGTILNGSALVAVPAFASLIGINIQTQPWLLWITIALYLVGLLLTALSNVIAYLSAAKWSQFYDHMRAKIEATINLSWYPPDNEPDIKAIQKHIKDLQAAELDVQTRSVFRANWAFCLALAGLLFFICGCVTFVCMLSGIQAG